MPQSTIAKRRSGGLVELVKTLVYAVVIALTIRSVAFEPFTIPSGSMIPTLLVGDFVFVSKYTYGYSHYSLPLSPPLFSGRIFGSVPARGDVVVFRLPTDTSTDYIKRIIGLPGDHIQVTRGQLFINGTQVPRVSVDEVSTILGGEETNSPAVQATAHRYIETLPEGRKHPILKLTDEGEANNTQEYVVPQGYLFAMGDNRDNSMDSRFQSAVGFVPLENLIGRAEFVFMSLDWTSPWYYFWQWPFEIRWGRLFSSVR